MCDYRTPFKSRLRTTADGERIAQRFQSNIGSILVRISDESNSYHETAPDKTKKDRFPNQEGDFSLPYFGGAVYILALLRRSIAIRYRVDGVLSLTFRGAEYISLGKYSVLERSGDRSG